MELRKIWPENYRVNWYDTDLNGNTKMSAVANYLQESAWRHANHLGFGYEDAKARNEMWVIVGLMIRMVQYPAWGETITVETWPKGIDRLFAFRDFKISDSHGNVLGAATSRWMILDASTHRPKKVDIVKPVLHLATHQDILNENPPHLPHLDHPTDSVFRQVQFSEVDFHGHVNNTRYIDWCLDAIPAAWHREHQIQSFTVNYLSEVKPGENIRIEVCSNQHAVMDFQGVRAEDGKIIFRAKSET